MFHNSFKRGVHPRQDKLTSKEKIQKAAIPDELVIPLKQHIGKSCSPTVSAGEYVKKYQKIGDSKEGLSLPIHAPTSGEVTSIEAREVPHGGKRLSIIIKPDGKDSQPDMPNTPKKDLDPEEIIERLKEAGIAGLGGAAFPAYAKLNVPKGKKAELLIINACECEPCLTCDHRVIVEYPRDIIKGIKLMMKACSAKKAVIGIEDNKPDAIKLLEEKLRPYNNISIRALKTKYPQGAEKMLIYALTKKVVPQGGLPIDVGIIVNNVSTAKAAHDAIHLNIPLVERVVTVTGDVSQPKNILAMVGTSAKDLINECGGFTSKPKKIIVGGPMMGLAQHSTEVPLMKGCGGLVIMSEPKAEEEYGNCIRCARCINACPMELMPATIARLSQNRKFNRAKSYYALDCFECGCCAYVCPSKIPLVQLIKTAKIKIKEIENRKVCQGKNN